MANKSQQAEAFLVEAGLVKAWELFNSTAKPASKFGAEALMTLNDMVSKLVKYGSLSDKQVGFLRVLVDRVVNADATEAKRAAEAAAAKPVPVTGGRVMVEGVVLTKKDVDTKFGWATKMLVKHADGWKVWGTKPGSLVVEVGDTVRFEAAVEVSKDDAKFGFFSRPTKAAVVATKATAVAA